MAVKTAEQSGSIRPIRFLMLKGARTDIKDKKGNKPVDLAAGFSD